MALTLTSTDTILAPVGDFIKYVSNRPVITRTLNQPSTLDVDVVNWNTDFVLPRRGSYFTLATSADPTFWTGYVIEDSELEYLGKESVTNQPQWGFKLKLTSSEYILNLAPVGFVGVFINQTQGAIIKDLANRIAPGVFDVSNVDDGQLMPYFFADITKTFSEIVKDFSESAYYAFWANDFKLYYKRQDTIVAPLIINGKTEYTSRVRITSSTNASPIVITTSSAHSRSNGDCITISGHSVNTAANGNWIIANVAGSTLELVGSTGNGVGGATGWAGLHNPHFTPERLQIGPVNDPVINDCIVIGDVEPQGLINEFYVGDGLTNSYPLLSSIYGVDSALLLDEIFAGAAIDSNKWLEVDSINNVIQVDNGYLNIIGNAADAYGVYLQSKALIPLQGNLKLTHGEYDFVTSTNDGVIASLWTATPSFSSGGPVAYPGCIYGIRVTVVDSQVILNPIINGTVQTDSYTAQLQSDNKRYIIRTLVNFENVYRRDRESLFRLITGTLGSYGGNSIPDHPVYRTIITEIDAETGKATTNQTLWTHPGAETGLGPTQFYAAYVPIVSNNLHLTLSNITISVPMQVSLETLNKEIWYPERNKFDVYDGSPIPADFTTLPWQPKIVGPNEIESYDGMSPVATIITSRQGRIDQGNILGSTLYNSGDANLAFFKDSIKQTANTPPPGQLVHLRYRRAGIAIGRAQNTTLIASEAAIWGDNGYRTITKKDLSPLPRTSLECEQVAAAMVEENSYQHYAGTYTQFSNYEFVSVTPIPGGILLFKNMPTTFPSIQAEQITKVVSTIESKSQEIFTHQVTFGKIDKVKKFLSSLRDGKNIFAPTDTAEVPTAQDLEDAVDSTNVLSLIFNPITLTLLYGGTSSVLPDTALNIDVDLKLKSWTSIPSDTVVSGITVDQEDTNYFEIEIGQAPPSGGGFEIRYADQGWGDVNNSNYLVYDIITNGQTTASSFKIARRLNSVVFVKAFDSSGRYSRYASGIRVVFPGIPGNPSSIVAKGGTLTHPIFKANLPINDLNNVVLNGDVYGIVAMNAYQLGLDVNVFARNGATISPYTPIGTNNPGPYSITPTSDGFDYGGADVVLPASPSGDEPFSDSGFINFETEISMTKGVSLFFCWVRAIGVDETDNLSIRLNIKDDLLPADSPKPFGFYSRHDYLLTGQWQPLFTVIDLPTTPETPSASVAPNYNLVLHNINTTNLTLKICLPFVCTSFYNHSDIVLGASEDSPGLNFTYENVGTEEGE